MRTCVHVFLMDISTHFCGRRNFFFLKIHFFLRIFFKIYFIYLFLAALGLRCCTQSFSNCVARGLLFVVVCRLLIAVASLVAEHRL